MVKTLGAARTRPQKRKSPQTMFGVGALSKWKSVLIIVVEASNLKELATLADRWNRPMALGDAGFARALGIRCIPSWIEIVESGKEGVIHESR